MPSIESGLNDGDLRYHYRSDAIAGKVYIRQIFEAFQLFVLEFSRTVRRHELMEEVESNSTLLCLNPHSFGETGTGKVASLSATVFARFKESIVFDDEPRRDSLGTGDTALVVASAYVSPGVDSPVMNLAYHQHILLLSSLPLCFIADTSALYVILFPHGMWVLMTASHSARIAMKLL
ncbi:unnamed protein product [Caenorhabditis auriculariae]|uniref:Uncharacterized protein n=1 Tax=Caenorhabditis auriculariae TaxID=2777116 RepID=A0A8S1HVQ2_9PELO|nr:unnamed protein product [Caenorhabditis auriculariae]